LDGSRSFEPDHENAKVILLFSAHLEEPATTSTLTQRVIDGKTRGAKLIVFDTRLSNTATHADYFITPYPGSEAAILLSIRRRLPDSEQSL
jgi:anaerobic selenocysteine-containing dehydrogenase